MSVVLTSFLEASAVAALGILTFIARGVWRGSRGLNQMLTDWRGQPGRPGVDPVPGVMERLQQHDQLLADIRHEVKPNSGLSMRDDISRIHQATTGHPAPGGQP